MRQRKFPTRDGFEGVSFKVRLPRDIVAALKSKMLWSILKKGQVAARAPKTV
jgi:hypothetical protein